MSWQVQTHCEHGFDDDAQQADLILAAAPTVGRPMWLLSSPPQLVVALDTEEAATLVSAEPES